MRCFMILCECSEITGKRAESIKLPTLVNLNELIESLLRIQPTLTKRNKQMIKFSFNIGGKYPRVIRA